MVKPIKSVDELNKLQEDHSVIMLKFSAVWCGPCQAVAPFIDDMEPQYPKVAMRSVDLDDCRELAEKFTITAVPTFLFIKDGEEIHRVMGGSIPQIKQTLAKLSEL